MSDTVKLYRTRVPAHNHIPPDTVAAFIADQVMVHQATSFGDRFTLAMIWRTAHEIEMTPGLGGDADARVTGQLTMQKDMETQRQYAQPQGTHMRGDDDEWLSLTTYGKRYMSLRAGTVGRIPIVGAPRELALRGAQESIADETA